MAASGIDVDDGRVARAAQHEFDQRRRRRSTGSVSGIMTMEVTPPAAAATAGRRDGLAVLAAGLADEDARVDQAGHDRLAARSRRRSAPSGHALVERGRAGGRDRAAVDDDRADLVDAARRIDDARVGEDA